MASTTNAFQALSSVENLTELFTTPPHSPKTGLALPPTTADCVLRKQLQNHPRAFHVAHANAQSLIGNIDNFRATFS